MNKEIQQDYNIGKVMSIIHRHGRCFMDDKLTNLGIGSGQYTFLFFLYKHDGLLNQDEISKSLEIDKGTTARALKKLEERGLVERRTDLKDKRKNIVYLTKKAKEIKGQLVEYSKEWGNILLENFSDDENKIVLEILEKISSNAINYKEHRCRRSVSNE